VGRLQRNGDIGAFPVNFTKDWEKVAAATASNGAVSKRASKRFSALPISNIAQKPGSLGITFEEVANLKTMMSEATKDTLGILFNKPKQCTLTKRHAKEN
jgi:hypothetical protein